MRRTCDDGIERKKYKLAVFDMDGTILNTLDDLTDSVNHALRMNGLPLRTRDEVKWFVGNGIRLTVERAVPPDCKKEITEKVFSDFKAYYSKHSADKTCAYPGIEQTLLALKNAGIMRACVSNKSDAVVKQLCEQYFKGLFDVAIGENEEAGIRKKPAPDEVNLVLQTLSVVKEEAIYIGDSDVDILTAVNSKLDMCAVTWGFRDKEFLIEKGAILLADTAEDLQSILLG